MKIEQSTLFDSARINKGTHIPFSKRAQDVSESNEVKLSKLASQLRTPGNEAPFDAERVAKIKQAISEGKFQINADAIADRLIVSAKELIGSRFAS
ncbi:MAG: flagellar biosynthesis anti-sigma factor FlgM [Candidatus Accumulibacter sp.]|jgi:flagellar biosynthesis anti-sigma factor FlgM|nr:flagellar biosynthesis anti-sigma factor FlgM [Accumulibacter sp.]